MLVTYNNFTATKQYTP